MPLDRNMGRKKSQFPVKTSVPSGAYVDFFESGVNWQITWTNYLASLGVTGTLSQLGAGTDTPVLFQQGSDNFIRNLNAGDGIGLSITAEGSISIKHNFVQDATGIPIITDIDTATPDVASLVAGTGIGFQVSGDGKVIEIEATGQAQPATKLVTVNQESDFPDAVSGVITLEESTAYLIANNVSTSSRFVLQAGTSLLGASPLTPLLTYTGSDTMFTANGVFSVSIRQLNFTAPSGKLFDMTSLILFSSGDCVVNACDSIGDFTDCANVNITNTGIFEATTQGIVLAHSGTGNIFAVDGLFVESTAGSGFTAIDLGTATYDTIEIQDLAVTAGAGNTGIDVAASSANISTGNLGQITDCNFTGGLTEATNNPELQVRWETQGNDGIPDSRQDGLGTLTANVTETVISVVDTPVKVTGTWVEDHSNSFTFDTNGRLTYNGERDLRVPIDISCSFLKASGSASKYTVYVAINGSTVGPGIPVTIGPTEYDSATLVWQHDFQTNDYVELFVESNAGTVNAICESAVMRIN